MEIQSLGRVIGALITSMLIITLATVIFLVINH